MIQDYLSDDHKTCDQLYAKAEEAVVQEDWTRADGLWSEFHGHTLHHFAMEEQVLFPELERMHGSPMGPTQVMRMEHDQVRRIASQLEAALKERDREAFLGYGETMLVLLQQHNMKEEQILYPMADGSLPGGQEVLERMKHVPRS